MSSPLRRLRRGSGDLPFAIPIERPLEEGHRCGGEGFSLVIYEGGSVDALVACAQGRHATALYALHDGDFVPYILGAPEFVNREFRELFADGLDAIRALVVKSEGSLAAN